MKRGLNLFLTLAILGLLFLPIAFSARAYAEAADDTIVSRTAEIDGVKLHDLTAGYGPTDTHYFDDANDPRSRESK